MGGDRVAGEQGTNLDVPVDVRAFEVTDIGSRTILVRMSGRWGDEVVSGLFSVHATESPNDAVDPVD